MELKNVSRTLSYALDSLDAQGVPGVLVSCLLGGTSSLLQGGGVCMDLQGACQGLLAATQSLRRMALHHGQLEAAQALADVVQGMERAVQASGGAAH